MGNSKGGTVMSTATKTPPSPLDSETVMSFEVGPGGLLRFLDVVPEPPGRICYQVGRVTVVSPSQPHEVGLEALDDVVKMICDELEIAYSPAGSTLLRRDDLDRGVMPDRSFYLEHHGAIDGVKETVDLRRYPPPDLVLEAVWTHGAAGALEILSAMGVPEVWVFEITKARLQFLQLDETGAYVPRDLSRSFPFLQTNDVLGQIQTIVPGEPRYLWKRRLRTWVQGTLRSRRAGAGGG